jgi:hypothetical protein
MAKNVKKLPSKLIYVFRRNKLNSSDLAGISYSSKAAYPAI